MLKGDAYGHGAVAVSKAADGIADWYGVATVEEGIELRINNITKPVLVTAYTPCDSIAIAQKNLTPIIYNLEQAEALSRAASSMRKIINIHVKVDTGMNRLGLKSLKEYQELINNIKCLPNLNLEGICTHFYDNNEETHIRQKAVFDRFLDNYKGLIVHAASSNAVVSDSKYHYDMVRVGISAYGYSENVSYFQPVMSVLSSIIVIKDVQKGEVAGYSGVFKAYKDTRLAIIRGGYYEGISRSLTGADVIIGRHKCKIVAVCMDVTIADIEDKDINVNDSVIIIGTLSDQINNADTLAAHSGTIPYEILTNIKGRIERIYYD